jgi:outer membrane protein OmpA-like peptidoglycan-associated protein
MTQRHLLTALGITFALTGCSTTQILRETAPVVVTARPAPEEPPETPRVVVKKDHIQLSEAIYFEADHAGIRAESNELLDEIAQVINAHGELVKIRVEGHTDSWGNPAANLALSKKRAMMVRSYLIERGVDARRLIAEGFGSENPIASNDNEDGRAKNRRVSFTILDRVDPDEDAPRTSMTKKHAGGAS